ncbi:MAG: RDD family protein [Thermoplasmata archaeon]
MLLDIIYEVLGNLSYILLPLLSFIILYSFVVDYEDIATRWGLNRLFISLIIVGSVFGFLANIPVFVAYHTLLAINIGGALIPLIVCYVFIKNVDEKKYIAYMISLIVFVGGSLGVIIFVPMPVISILFSTLPVSAILFTIVFDVIIYMFLKESKMYYSLLLTEFIAFLTYSITVVVLSQGIESAFPYYLAPSFAGTVLSYVIWNKDHMRVSFSSYFTTTIGVLVGADIFHQPSLFGPNISLAGSIGGAGPLDMVFQSGLMAFVFSLLFFSWSKVYAQNHMSEEDKTLIKTSIYYNKALSKLKEGKYWESMEYSKKMLDEKISSIMTITSTYTIEELLKILPKEYFNPDDYNKLKKLYEEKKVDSLIAGDAFRGASYLSAGIDNFKNQIILTNAKKRFIAETIDITIIAIPLFLILLFLVKGKSFVYIENFLSTTLFNIIYIGATTIYLFYYVFGEMFYGTTIGKKITNIKVTTIKMKKLSFESSLMRNLTKMPMLLLLFLLLFDGSILVNFAFFYKMSIYFNVFNFILIIAIFVIIAYIIPYLIMASNTWNQRFGDIVSQTIVINNWQHP